jgi:hypothetical protein
MGAAIVDPNTPKTLRDRLILFVAQLRDDLTLEKSLDVYAAEAEAVITAFVSADSTQSPQLSPEETLLGERGETSVELARPRDNQ